MSGDLHHLIPAHKLDLDAVARARASGYPAIAPVLSELLTCLQDLNWPVATPVAALLGQVGAPVIPHISAILRGDDDVWKYGVLTAMVSHWNGPVVASLVDDCLRIVNHPTSGELEEGVHLAARDVLILHAHDM
jgi:hypothetical protein